jgi:hypothetical protein
MDTYEKGKQDGEILQELKSIGLSLDRIEGIISGQETRIRTLESWRWYLAGAVALGTGLPQVVKAFF